MRGIDIGAMACVDAVLRLNPARLGDDPVTTIPPPAGMAANSDGYSGILAQQERVAKRFDYYQDILCISVRYPSGQIQQFATPYITPDDAPHGLAEASALWEFWNAVYAHNVRLIAGWRLALFMPTLIYKAMMYKVPVPDLYKQDLQRTFGSAEGFLHIEGIYSQGVNPPFRPLPELTDLVAQCDIELPNAHPILTAAHYEALTPEQWSEYGFDSMANRLHAMHALITRYYGL